ncbi:hypothetical protein V3589_02515 [Sinorhizobium fredii]|uniref:hypothetical protein n=1 Tax=Rhizobium fredii TaxID=380 RepID=UPI0030A0F53C
MQKWLVGVSLLAMTAEAKAFSPQQEQFLDQVAEAYVISDVCESLGFQTEALAVALRWNRLEGPAAVEEIRKRSAGDRWGIRQNRPDMACVLGEMYYGKQGTKRQGLLHPK